MLENLIPSISRQHLHRFPTLTALLRHRAIYQPDQIAFIFLQDEETESAHLTYAELDQQAQAIAVQLQSIKASGERALLLYPPGLDYIAAFFGCLYANVVAVPAYPPRRNQKMSRLMAIVRDAQATVALTTTAVLSNLKDRFPETPELGSLRWLATDNTSQQTLNWQEPKVSSDTLAFLQYTSGSTGIPKGVMVTHGNLLHNSELIHNSFEHTSKSWGLIWLPPYHDMGLIGGVLQPLYAGFPVTFMSPAAFLQKPIRWLNAITRYKATTSGGPNFAYELCVQKITPEQRENLDLSSWEVAFNGAEPIRPDTLDRFAATFEPCGFRREAFYPCYGMAETTLIVTGGLKKAAPVVCSLKKGDIEQNRVVVATPEKEEVRQIVGCGQELSNQVLIVDPESLTRCASDQVGEIWVSGLSVAQGYWNRPVETQKAFHAFLADTGEGPFLRTGDLGFLQNGELFITGRIKDVIIIRGRNHYPHDIELTVEQSNPVLKPSSGAVFTVEVEGKERLVIVQEVERNYLRKLDVNKVVGDIRQAVATEHEQQVYAAVLVKTGSIPKTSSGKIQRHACRAAFLTGSLDVVEDWSENPQSKTKFVHLNAEVDSLLQQLQTSKISNDTKSLKVDS
ncbi:fatty acyl-AMP ligase [aff. Roholtiella sp. LEGE 12411]|uniref:fatty acyl-AMP ligase n=1 Tax=aff. Roholtiella sp. LEGE 12411 TaxID=1828822 RepID=UPI00187F9EBF|nr:fatty acyl-AMP ligase [aff. Roholtiella sp. LEGE 12411]MBE9037509.1 fatty acyl-AMP ligase [aff. Roholtiella sp. LEGE 12411]